MEVSRSPARMATCTPVLEKPGQDGRYREGYRDVTLTAEHAKTFHKIMPVMATHVNRPAKIAKIAKTGFLDFFKK